MSAQDSTIRGAYGCCAKDDAFQVPVMHTASPLGMRFADNK
jgi:hypothetical protein